MYCPKGLQKLILILSIIINYLSFNANILKKINKYQRDKRLWHIELKFDVEKSSEIEIFIIKSSVNL